MAINVEKEEKKETLITVNDPLIDSLIESLISIEEPQYFQLYTIH